MMAATMPSISGSFAASGNGGLIYPAAASQSPRCTGIREITADRVILTDGRDLGSELTMWAD